MKNTLSLQQVSLNSNVRQGSFYTCCYAFLIINITPPKLIPVVMTLILK